MKKAAYSVLPITGRKVELADRLGRYCPTPWRLKIDSSGSHPHRWRRRSPARTASRRDQGVRNTWRTSTRRSDSPWRARSARILVTVSRMFEPEQRE